LPIFPCHVGAADDAAGDPDVSVRHFAVRVQRTQPVVGTHAEPGVRLLAERVVDEPVVAVRRLWDV
jgi:hypothetical protein